MKPIGFIDEANQNFVRGWAFDGDADTKTVQNERRGNRMDIKLTKDYVLTGTSYLGHFGSNVKIAGKCLALVFFHLVHGLVPVKYTNHKYWRIGE